MKIRIKTFWPALAWLVISTIAFCLPGKALPDKNWFAYIQLDKWIHVGIFAFMIIFWCLPLFYKQGFKVSLPKMFIIIVILFFGYGVAMEFIQDSFIQNRSFDLGDIAADACGCLIGFLFVARQRALLVK